MKRFLLLVLLSLLLPAARANAAGVGFYATSGLGSADWTDSYSSGYSKFSTDTERKGLGISMDTHLSGRHFFNYHFDFGYETNTIKNFVTLPYTGPAVTSSLDLKGFSMSHAFGFGGKLGAHNRIWLGPEIRAQWGKGSPAGAPNVDVRSFGFGIGPAVGIDLNFRNGNTIIIKTGYQIMTHTADVDGYVSGMSVSESYDVDERFFYINLEFLFRSPGDR